MSKAQNSTNSTNQALAQLLPGLKHAVIVLISYAVLLTAFFSPVLLSNQLIAPGDAWLISVPPFFVKPMTWCQSLMCGSPWISELQRQTFYPLHALFSWAGLWNAYIISAYVMAASFTYGFTYSLTKHIFPAAFAGALYALNGFLIGHACHIGLIHAAAYLPLLLWSVLNLQEQFKRGWFVAGIASVALSLLSGHTQTSVYSFGLAVAFALFLCFSDHPRKPFTVAFTLMMVVLGTSLACVQLVPTYELTELTPRSALSFERFVSYSLIPIQGLSFIFPQLFGGPVGSPYGVPYFGPWDLESCSTYLGLLPILLMAVAAPIYRKLAASWFWLAVCLISFILLFGGNSPLAYLFYLLPGYNMFRSQSRHLLELSMAVCVLCSYSLGAIEQQMVSRKQFLNASFFATGAFIAFFIFLGLSSKQLSLLAHAHGLEGLSFFPWSNASVAVPIVIYILISTALYFFVKDPEHKRIRVALAVSLLLDLGSLTWFAQWRYGNPTKDLLSPPSVAARYKQLLSSDNKHQRIFTVRGHEGSNSELPPDVSALWGVESASGYTPLMLTRYCQFMGTIMGGGIFRPIDPNSSNLDIASVRYIFVARHAPIIQRLTGALLNSPDRFRKVEDLNDDVSVYENLRAMPRAWLVSTAVSTDDKQALQTVLTSTLPDGRKFDPATTAVIESTSPLTLTPSTSDRSETADIVRVDGDVFEVRTNTKSQRLLVLSQTDFPGWTARVDGQLTDILKTDYLFQGVVVAAGSHLVRLRYTPATTVMGMAVSLFGLVTAIIVTALLGKFLKRKESGESNR